MAREVRMQKRGDSSVVRPSRSHERCRAGLVSKLGRLTLALGRFLWNWPPSGTTYKVVLRNSGRQIAVGRDPRAKKSGLEDPEGPSRPPCKTRKQRIPGGQRTQAISGGDELPVPHSPSIEIDLRKVRLNESAGWLSRAWFRRSFCVRVNRAAGTYAPLRSGSIWLLPVL